MGAVSYTHLDVYKRQLMTRMTPVTAKWRRSFSARPWLFGWGWAVSAARGVRDSNFVSGMAVPPLLVYNGNVCRRRGK